MVHKNNCVSGSFRNVIDQLQQFCFCRVWLSVDFFPISDVRAPILDRAYKERERRRGILVHIPHRAIFPTLRVLPDRVQYIQIQTKNIHPVNPVIPDKPIQIHSALFPYRVPGWPIGDTRRGFHSRRADFPARLCGLAAVCRVRFVRQPKKIPDAVFSGGIAALGRGFCAEVGHFPSAVIAAWGGQGKEKRQAFLPISAGWVLPWTGLSCSMQTW